MSHSGYGVAVEETDRLDDEVQPVNIVQSRARNNA